MTTMSGRQSTPLSQSGSVEERELGPKKSKNRKPAKKAIPRSSTLHGLWGKTKSLGEPPEDPTDEQTPKASKTDHNEVTTAGQLIGFNLGPSKFAAASEYQCRSERLITPPPSISEVASQSPAQSDHSVNETPKSSRGSRKKRVHPENPSEAARRSPRFNQPAQEPSKETLPTKPHPFFLGKAARMCLT